MPTYYEMMYLWIECNAYAINMFEILVGLAAAYMIVAYNAGVKLTRLQVCLLNTVYIFVSGLVAWSYIGFRFQTGLFLLEAEHLVESQALEFQYLLRVPDGNYPFPQMVMAALISLAILLLSLGFMWAIRHGSKHIAPADSRQDKSNTD